MDSRFPVEHIMKRKVTTLKKDSTAAEASILMRANKIGSVIVVEGEKPLGIVTIKDLVTKVMALKKAPEKTSLGSIMSSPLIAVDKHADMNEVAKLMGEHDIRRVIVTEGDKLAGIVTDKDILDVQPVMVDVLKEFVNVYGGKHEDKFRSKKGMCEVCDAFSKELVRVDERWLCPDCRKEVL